MQQTNINRIIYSSSAAIYGEQKVQPVSEQKTHFHIIQRLIRGGTSYQGLFNSRWFQGYIFEIF